MNPNLIKAFLCELLQQDDPTTANILGDYLEELGDPRAEMMRKTYSPGFQRINAVRCVMEFLPQRYAVQFVRECVGRMLPYLERESRNEVPREVWMSIRGWISGTVTVDEVDVLTHALKSMRSELTERLQELLYLGRGEDRGLSLQIYMVEAFAELVEALKLPEESSRWREHLHQARSRVLNVVKSDRDPNALPAELQWQAERLEALLTHWDAEKLV